jgi:NADPH-dependent curcumin reductase CurA
MNLQNRQWLLKQRPAGALRLENFEFREQALQEPELAPGQVLVRNLVFSCAPTMRNWMNDATRSYRTPVALGEPITGPACAQVVKSAHPRFAVGTLLVGVSSWQDYSILEPDNTPIPVIAVPADIAPTDALSIYGLNSLTAYFGLLRIGKPKVGETLVVSAAAGSVGSMVVQLGKLYGCRVIGIAGGRAKCEWLKNSCGIAAIDYKTTELTTGLGRRLARLAPNGIDVFFDNVGGAMLQAVTEHMAVHGRIVVCGQVSAYDSDQPAPGPRDMMLLVYRRLLMQGFVLGDFVDEIPTARHELTKWVAAGKIQRRDDVRTGFVSLPAAFLDLFSGKNTGALLVKVANAT